MRPPCELVQREYLPILRAALARKLKERGFSQNEIAQNIGVTQAAVSKYLNQPSSKTRLTQLVSSPVTTLVDMITDKSSSSDQIVKEVCSTCMRLRIGSEICRLHKVQIPSLSNANCSICSELLGGNEPSFSEHLRVLDEMFDALSIIENSETFKLVIPQVRANLVACDESAETTSDVVGIPGRITLVGGKAKATESPRFDASHHTANLLIQVKTSWPRICSCLCISGRDDVIKASDDIGLVVVSISDSTSDVQSIASGFTNKVTKKNFKIPIALHVPGGIGVEPILYLFGATAIDLGHLSDSISKALVNV